MPEPTHAETLRKLVPDYEAFRQIDDPYVAALKAGADALEALGQYREALARCHELLADSESHLDPEVHPELTALIEVELLPCDGSMECPTLPSHPTETPK